VSDEQPTEPSRWKLWVFLAWSVAATISLGAIVWVYRELRSYERHVRFEPNTLENDSAARERLGRITAELEGAGLPEWAGTFSFGFEDVDRVDLAPKNGIVIRLGEDSRDYKSHLHGVVLNAVENRITFAFEPAASTPRSYDIEGGPECWSDVTMLRWGERDYLVPTSHMLDFCNAVNAGWEWKHRGDGGKYPSRLARSSRPSPSGSNPAVPAEYRGFLLDHAVSAHVLEAEREPVPSNVVDVGQSGRTFAWLDAGSNQGLKTGMLFYWTIPNGCSPGEIVELETDRSRAIFLHGPLSPSLVKPLAPGVVVSTKRPD
jgi:hypothetical protein